MRAMGFETIGRRELPACERRGAVAAEVVGHPVVVVCHEAAVDIETLYGVPVGVSADLRNTSFGLSNTVLFASYNPDYRHGDVVPLLDVYMADKVSLKKKKLIERYKVLRRLVEHMTDEAKIRFPMSREWRTGLLRAYDECSEIGGGLWLRVPGNPRGVLCMEV